MTSGKERALTQEDSVGTVGVLEGIRVIDFTLFQAGPYAAAMLGDLGADVIHIEEPGRGDPLRGIKITSGVDSTLAWGRHALVEEIDRNKRSATIDLRKEEGKQIIYRLVETADVFVTNFREKSISKMGLGYETLSAINPRLIYARSSGFGFRGPEADRPAVDLVVQARSGAMMESGEEGDPPTYLPNGMGDRAAGTILAYGIVAALLARERRGGGQLVETSLLGAMLILQANNLSRVLLTGKEPYRHNRRSAGNPLFNWYQCKDGRWMVLALLQDRRYWPSFCEAVGRPDLEHDPRFDSTEKRRENCEELVALLDEIFASKGADEWDRVLRGGDLLFSQVNRMVDVVNDPLPLAEEYIIQCQDHPVLGNIRLPGFPLRFSKTPLTLRRYAPECGEHTEEVLIEMGYDWDKIALLKEQGVI